jgi:hypothetical protein
LSAVVFDGFLCFMRLVVTVGLGGELRALLLRDRQIRPVASNNSLSS